jgi:MFS family permease
MSYSSSVEDSNIHTPDGESYNWTALIGVGLGSFLATMEAGINNIMPAPLVEAFDSDLSTILWFSIIYFVAGTGPMLFIGWLGDSIGRRRLYLIGFLASILGLTLVASSPNLVQLLISRVVHGMGLAFLLANADALTAQSFPLRHRGKAIGFVISTAGMGFFMGPMLGGLIMDHLDWRAVYWMRIPIAVVGFLYCYRFLVEKRAPTGIPVRIDYLGMALMYGLLAFCLLTINLGGRWGLDVPLIWAFAGGTLVLLLVFIIVERRVTNPIIDGDLFRNRLFAVAHISNALNFMAIGAVTIVIPFFLLRGVGLSLSIMGALAGIVLSARIIVAPIGGALFDKMGSRILTILGLILMIVGLVLLSRLTGNSTLWVIAIVFAIVGIGTSAADAANSSAIMYVASNNQLGLASASIPTFTLMAMSAGVTLGGAVYAAREISYHNAGQSDALAATSAFSDVALIIAGLVAITMVISWFRGSES